MQTWVKFAVSFFALGLILTGFIFAFGPASTRAAFRSGETQTGQLRADHQTLNPGEPNGMQATSARDETVSGASLPIQSQRASAPANGRASPPQGPEGLYTEKPSTGQ